jgi:hypothetical protein
MGVLALATASFTFAANPSTLEDLQSTASAVKIHADQINAIYRTTGFDWNAEHLQAIKDETNRMGRDLTRLREGSLTPNEERAINQATPILQSIAADTTGAIQAVNEKGRPVDNNGPLFNDRFHDRMVSVGANAARAERIFADLRQFEKARGPLESHQGNQKGLPGEPSVQPAEAGR